MEIRGRLPVVTHRDAQDEQRHGLWPHESPTLSAGSLLVFIWYLGKMYKPMQDVAKMTDSYSKAAVGYERIKEVFDTKPQVQDLPTAKPAPRFKGEIEFDHVHFSYAPGQRVLNDVSFKVSPGHMTALVGPTGAGKTTIASLIGRFYDPASGCVKIDGHDVRDFTQKSLRDQISFILQESILFRAPIWQNIAYGKPEASRAEVYRAANWRMHMSSSRNCRMATTRSLENEELLSQADSVNASPSPVRLSATLRS